MAKRLGDLEIKRQLESLPGWVEPEGKLKKEYSFKNFVDAFTFMGRVAFLAEAINHHPDWSNAYNRVLINLTTHDVGGITGLDVEFAKSLEDIFSKH